ncbi:unnamed protein product [Lactuca virosa]|uniref:Uncharacterized protein n=1 Tax=Lactuca virosa TaxID=75947 RepID=A0AAU9P4F3_9ASTR|nr:unnamed protein product [Lactuca virosa]
MGRCNLFPIELYFKKSRYQQHRLMSYVLDCPVRTKNSYIPYLDTNFFIGPSTLLVLFYADKIHSKALMVPRKRPPICYWSSEKIRYRETFEQEIGKFGLGELNEDIVYEQVEEDTNQGDSDSDEDEDEYVEVYKSKLFKMFDTFERMKERLNSKLSDAITKFPKKESFRNLKDKITNLVVEDKNGSMENFQAMKLDLKGVNGEEDNDNDGPEPEVDYLLDGNDAENDGETNKKGSDEKKMEGETEGTYNDREINENENDEEKKR